MKLSHVCIAPAGPPINPVSVSAIRLRRRIKKSRINGNFTSAWAAHHNFYSSLGYIAIGTDIHSVTATRRTILCGKHLLALSPAPTGMG